MNAPVVVGYDGSESSTSALDWAVREAKLRELPLSIVCAFLIPVGGIPHTLALDWPQVDKARAAHQRLVDEAVERVRGREPDLEVSAEVIDSVTIGATLIEKSDSCELMVLGSRGRGGFAGLLLGSTGVQVAAHARCPLITVRESSVVNGQYPGQIVVGVDGSEVSMAALEFALKAASIHDCDLVAVHVWDYPAIAMPGSVVPVAYDRQEFSERESALLAESLAGCQERYPNVNIIRRVETGEARQVMLDISAGCRLVVVGSRGHGGFTGMLLGSTSQALLHHAEAPVAVVRPRSEPED